MPLIQTKCSNCGANIKINSDNKNGFCEHCGAEYITEEVINNYQTINQYNTTQNITKTVLGKDSLESAELIKNGDVFISLGEFTKAEKAYNKAIELNPADWKGWFGIVKVKTKDFSDYYDISHFEYLEKAKKVANIEQKEEINNLYRGYQLQLNKINEYKSLAEQERLNKEKTLVKETQLTKDKKMFNKLSFVSFVVIFIIVIIGGGFLASMISPDTSDEPIYETIVNQDDTLTITKCLKESAIMVIPEKINGKKVTCIGDNAFINSTIIEDVTIPHTISSIDDKAFFNGEKIRIIRLKSGLPPSLGLNVFDKYEGTEIVPMNIKILVPDNCFEVYIKAWPQYSEQIYSELNPDIKRIIFTLHYDYMYDNKTEEKKLDSLYNDVSNIYIIKPNRVGYNFDGWYLDSNYTSEKITTLSKSDCKDVYLFAKWTPKQVYLSFDGNGSTSGSMQNVLLTVDEASNLPDNLFQRAGYTFVGWTKEKNSNDIIENNGIYIMEPTTYEVVKVYAKWAKDVYTIDDLNTINENNNCFYTLKNDIDLKNKNFITIQEFYGVFNGNGYKLKNSSNAIFIKNYGKINNLLIENCAYSKISNPYGDSYIGGFIAYNDGEILNCSFNGVIDAGHNTTSWIYIGGFCGFNRGAINSSKAEISISSVCGCVGGFIGSTSGQIDNCYVIGNMNVQTAVGMYTYAAGFAGKIAGNIEIINCYSNVNIEASAKCVAGFSALKETSSLTIANCFAVGNINANISDVGTVGVSSIGGFSCFTLPSNSLNIFRSDNNLFSEGNINSSGELIELSKFYTSQFYADKNMFDKYIDDENIENNKNSVWIINDEQLPKLYWEVL